MMNNPTWRYSKLYSSLKYNTFKYKPSEEILDRVMEFIKFSGMDGDYLEFGVWEGFSFSTAYHLSKRHNIQSMKFYAFDSFEGLPKTNEVEGQGFEKGMFSCSLEDFLKNMKRKRVNLEEINTIKGFYDKTLNESTKRELKIKKASVIYIDCDLYKSIKPVLKFITSCIQDGTIIVFDDWFCFRGHPNKGGQKAFREWLVKNPKYTSTQFYKFGVHGNSFIINEH